MTTDVDALLPDISIMKEAINHVGDELQLPNGWLNADFMKTSSYSKKLALYSVPYKTFYQVLNVRLMTGEYLIAMKLRAGRRYKNDLSDIIGILSEHQARGIPISFEQIDKAVDNLYGGWEQFPDGMLSYIQQAVVIPDLVKAYEDIRKSEQQTETRLIQLEENDLHALSQQSMEKAIDRVSEPMQTLTALLEILQNKQENL